MSLLQAAAVHMGKGTACLELTSSQPGRQGRNLKTHGAAVCRREGRGTHMESRTGDEGRWRGAAGGFLEVFVGADGAAVGGGDAAAPLEELLAAVVAVEDALDEDQPLVRLRLLDRCVELEFVVDAHGEGVRVAVGEGVDEGLVVPVLDVVVRAVVDLDLDGVAAVVQQEDDRVLPVPDHRRHLLRRHLEGAVADEGDDALLVGGSGVRDGLAQHGAHGPPDGAVLHLELVLAAVGEVELLPLEPRVARLRDDGE
mmetsp:Transcript_10882/g.19059  ORF Transcript_10882/g.19059 Transcript_10882/m.19059 type:complete len:255 (-) Transcript_10882:1225-1989(-)